jgi:hypothetical protein
VLGEVVSERVEHLVDQGIVGKAALLARPH